jgi:anti-sigma factor RsiW
MNRPEECGQELLLQAEFDGELDAAQAAQLAAHRERCPQCQAAARELAQSRQIMRGVTRHTLSPQARAALLAAIPRESSVVPFERTAKRWRTLSAVLTGALAATIVAAFLVGRPPDIEARLLDSHLRALRGPALLTDVAASSHHTVKPWFAGRLNYAPIVKDLDAFGFVLLGGRIDVVDGQQVAVVAYQAGRHTIDVFELPSTSVPSGMWFPSQREQGFNLRHWNEGELSLWCISDLAGDELDAFVARWRSST